MLRKNIKRWLRITVLILLTLEVSASQSLLEAERRDSAPSRDGGGGIRPGNHVNATREAAPETAPEPVAGTHRQAEVAGPLPRHVAQDAEATARRIQEDVS